MKQYRAGELKTGSVFEVKCVADIGGYDIGGIYEAKVRGDYIVEIGEQLDRFTFEPDGNGKSLYTWFEVIEDKSKDEKFREMLLDGTQD